MVSIAASLRHTALQLAAFLLTSSVAQSFLDVLASDPRAPTELVPKEAAAPWYQGIDSIKVFSPGDDVAGPVYGIYTEMKDAQFSTKRYAVLLRSGNYGDLEMPLGYYTSIIGVGQTRWDVQVASFYSLDGPAGGATDNFWRSVEGFVATNPSITWATSQACPVRRVVVQGDLWLSEPGPPHWSSGGFVGDVIVQGRTYVGTQQQFFFRNSQMNGGVAYETGAWNFVFVGVDGAPDHSTTGKTGEVSTIYATPLVAEKPFLVESNGDWSIRVPPIRANSHGIGNDMAGYSIPMNAVFVATASMSAQTINMGIMGKRALLLTPGVYGLQEPIRVSQANFVVLGLGFATLVAPPKLAAITVQAPGVRVASILVEAGAQQGTGITEPLVLWRGAGGVMTDMFTRAGSFAYSSPFHDSCVVTRASIHVQVDGQGVILDNTWFWHADHDDCGTKSDSSFSGNGLVVHGSGVICYGLKVEHMMANLVEWYGENGQVFFFQSELPYHDPGFGNQGFVGYKVDSRVGKHFAIGLGVYIVGGLRMPTAFRVPPWVTMRNMLIWCITGSVNQFASVVCTSDGTAHCLQGDQCFGSACYLSALPSSSALPAATLPASTPPASVEGWTHYAQTTCHPEHGGSPLLGSNDLVQIQVSVPECQAICENAGTACEGILMAAGQDARWCLLLTGVTPSTCERSAGYDLWLRSGRARGPVESALLRSIEAVGGPSAAQAAQEAVKAVLELLA